MYQCPVCGNKLYKLLDSKVVYLYCLKCNKNKTISKYYFDKKENKILTENEYKNRNFKQGEINEKNKS